MHATGISGVVRKRVRDRNTSRIRQSRSWQCWKKPVPYTTRVLYAPAAAHTHTPTHLRTRPPSVALRSSTIRGPIKSAISSVTRGALDAVALPRGHQVVAGRRLRLRAHARVERPLARRVRVRIRFPAPYQRTKSAHGAVARPRQAEGQTGMPRRGRAAGMCLEAAAPPPSVWPANAATL